MSNLSIISLIAIVNALGYGIIIPLLSETNKHKGLVQHEKLFDFGHLIRALLDKNKEMLRNAFLTEIEAYSQGSIQGINASYMSVGMILGPILGGVLATWYLPLPFLGASVLTFGCFILSLQILRGARIRQVGI